MRVKLILNCPRAHAITYTKPAFGACIINFSNCTAVARKNYPISSNSQVFNTKLKVSFLEGIYFAVRFMSDTSGKVSNKNHNFTFKCEYYYKFVNYDRKKKI